MLNLFPQAREHMERLREAPGAHLIVLNGPRRVGKTHFLKGFMEKHGGTYLPAGLYATRKQIQKLAQRLDWPSEEVASLNTWKDFFTRLATHLKEPGEIVVLDDYPLLEACDPRIDEALKETWPLLSERGIFLVLAGSNMGVADGILDDILRYQVELRALNFFDAQPFFGRIPLTQSLAFYGIYGGLPSRLACYNQGQSFDAQVRNHMLDTHGYLYNAAYTALTEVLRQPLNYCSILMTLAEGHQRLQDLVRLSGLERGMVVKYVDSMRRLGLIKRELPVSERDIEKSRKGIYRFRDWYLHFYFRFILPNRGFIEEGRGAEVWDRFIAPNLDEYQEWVFHDVCRQFTRQKAASGGFPFEVAHVGAHWDANQHLPLVGLDRDYRRALLGACFWEQREVTMADFEALKAKGKILAKQQGWELDTYILFSRQGFSADLVELDEPNLLRVSL